MRSKLIAAIQENQIAFGLSLTDDAVERLADYYDLIQEHNPILHLVGPCSPEEFAIRHILESLTLLEHLPNGTKFADVGAGAGLPSIPCLLVREDLRAVLIESKLKKVGFLQMVLAKCKLGERSQVLGNQFSDMKTPCVSYVTCRALDKFAEKLPGLIRWSGNCTLFFFGGPSLKEAFIANGISVTEKLLPMSEKRFLFVAERGYRNGRKSDS